MLPYNWINPRIYAMELGNSLTTDVPMSANLTVRTGKHFDQTKYQSSQWMELMFHCLKNPKNLRKFLLEAEF